MPQQRIKQYRCKWRVVVRLRNAIGKQGTLLSHTNTSNSSSKHLLGFCVAPRLTRVRWLIRRLCYFCSCTSLSYLHTPFLRTFWETSIIRLSRYVVSLSLLVADPGPINFQSTAKSTSKSNLRHWLGTAERIYRQQDQHKYTVNSQTERASAANTYNDTLDVTALYAALVV